MNLIATPHPLRRGVHWVSLTNAAASESSLRDSLTAACHLALHRHCSSRLLSREFDRGPSQQGAPISHGHKGFAAQPLTRAPTAMFRACDAEVFASPFQSPFCFPGCCPAKTNVVPCLPSSAMHCLPTNFLCRAYYRPLPCAPPRWTPCQQSTAQPPPPALPSPYTWLPLPQ